MHKKDTKNAATVIKMLLDIYARKTTLPVAYYDLEKDSFVWSSAGEYSGLCVLLNDKFVGGRNSCAACNTDHIVRCKLPNGKPELCHAGLWNIALPVEIEGKVIGTLISGQRRLAGEVREALSRQRFEDFARNGCAGIAYSELLSSYESTGVVDEKGFDSNLLGNLKEVQEVIYRWFYEHERDSHQMRLRVQALAHDFLIPIQAIIADAENILIETAEGDIKDIATNILEEMQKLAIIAENMRSSLIGAKFEPYEFSSHSTLLLLKEAIRLFEREAKKKGVSIRTFPDLSDYRSFPQIEMSWPHMKTAIHNIIHNAVKYSYSSLQGDLYVNVTCKTEKELTGRYFVISVENLGTGILPNEIDDKLIFEPGYRGRLSADKHRTGSGLGLSEVKKTIDAHRGRIEVYSKPGKHDAYKTTVRLHLPYRHSPTSEA